MATLPPKMSLSEYMRWIGRPEARKASLPSFFPNGVRRTMSVLRGKAKASSVKKWESFGARHYAQYKKDPTNKRKFALKNWGFKVPRKSNERRTI